MSYSYRLHISTYLAVDTPAEIIAWLRDGGDVAAMISAVPGAETRAYLGDLIDWLTPFVTEVEEQISWTEADPTPRVWRHRLALMGRIHDDSVMVGFGLVAMLAPYADEGMLGVWWTDQHQSCDPTFFLVQEGRPYMADRYSSPQHIALDGSDPVPWKPFPIGDPEADRPTS